MREALNRSGFKSALKTKY